MYQYYYYYQCTTITNVLLLLTKTSPYDAPRLLRRGRPVHITLCYIILCYAMLYYTKFSCILYHAFYLFTNLLPITYLLVDLIITCLFITYFPYVPILLYYVIRMRRPQVFSYCILDMYYLIVLSKIIFQLQTCIILLYFRYVLSYCII